MSLTIHNFQELLDESLAFPEEANLDNLLTLFDETIENLLEEEKLFFAGEILLKISAIVKERSNLVFEEIEADRVEGGTILPPNFFDRFVRQSQNIDFFEFVVPPPEPLSRSRNSYTSVIEK